MEYKAFKDLTKEERSEIVEARLFGAVEWRNLDGVWHKEEEGCVYLDAVYRIKPAKKLDIPWEIIKPEYKWAAMDEGGEIFLFGDKPLKEATYWCTEHFEDAYTDCALLLDTTGISWENSLTQRPEGI